MDIWRWVAATKRELRQSGHGRLADLMSELPTLVCNDEHGRVEAVVPEALALARAARNPWVEVFVRHWALQSRVLHRYEASEHLAEAVELLEFANREETRQCPQSICVVQDLAACYSCADGPGYVPERLAVASETLARIDPSWPCFRCISIEHANALRDDERHEEALAFLLQQIDRSAAAGSRDVPRFVTARVDALLALGRVSEAWALMEDHEAEPEGGSGREVDVALTRARVLCALGRHDEAREVLPAFEVVAATPSHYKDYVEAVDALVSAGALPNDWGLGARARQMMERARTNGAWFLAARIAALATRWAAARGAWVVARAALEDTERLCAKLRKPERIPVAELREALEAAAGRAVPLLPEAPQEVQASLPSDPEAALEILAAARRRWPEHEPLVVMQARALVACGLEARAEASLREHVEHHLGGGAELAVVELGRTLLAQGRHDALRELVAASMQGEALRAQGLWLRASSHVKLDELDGAIRCLSELVELDPEASTPRHRLASLQLRQGLHAEALANLDVLAQSLPPGEHDWDRMTVATIVGAWDRLRDSARRLELEFPGLDDDGPVDTPMGLCRVRFIEADGTTSDYYAQRRSPVCARVVQMAGPQRPEHFADLVVLDGGPLNLHERGEERGDEEGDDDWIALFPVVHVVSEGGFRCWSLDGTHPGEHAWSSLEGALQAMGGVVDVRSDEAYRHVDPEHADRELPGVFAYVCMPRELPPAELHARLSELTAGWEHPLVWPEVVQALPPGQERERALLRVEEITERYEL